MVITEQGHWRDYLELDWVDVPGPVKERVASVVACDGVSDLDPGARVIGKGGEETWQRRRGDDE